MMSAIPRNGTASIASGWPRTTRPWKPEMGLVRLTGIRGCAGRTRRSPRWVSGFRRHGLRALDRGASQRAGSSRLIPRILWAMPRIGSCGGRWGFGRCIMGTTIPDRPRGGLQRGVPAPAAAAAGPMRGDWGGVRHQLHRHGVSARSPAFLPGCRTRDPAGPSGPPGRWSATGALGTGVPPVRGTVGAVPGRRGCGSGGPGWVMLGVGEGEAAAGKPGPGAARAAGGTTPRLGHANRTSRGRLATAGLLRHGLWTGRRCRC